MTKISKIIGNHPDIRNVRRRIRKVSLLDINVVITGEPGTEKGLAAEAIHKKSKRAGGKIVFFDCFELKGKSAVNCSQTLSNLLIKAETGALVLENVEMIPAAGQEEMFRLINYPNKGLGGSNNETPRIISISTGDTFDSNNKFNKQLSLKLKEFEIFLPPLRKRKGDLPLLFDHYLTIAAEERGYADKPGAPDIVYHSIIAHDWKGNTAELQKTVEVMLELSPPDLLSADAIPFDIRPNPFSFLDALEYHEAIKSVDVYLVKRALDRAGWNQTRAADILNMSEGNLRLKMRKYNIKREE